MAAADNVMVEFLFPDRWWVDEHPDGDSFRTHTADFMLDVLWIDYEGDATVLLDNNLRSRLEVEYVSEQLLEWPIPTSGTYTMTTFTQHLVGGLPVINDTVYESIWEDNWTDLERLSQAGAFVVCGPERICWITLDKPDESLTVEDWELLEWFVSNLEFVGEDPLPAKYLTPKATPTETPTAEKQVPSRRTSTPVATDIPDPTNTPQTTTDYTEVSNSVFSIRYEDNWSAESVEDEGIFLVDDLWYLFMVACFEADTEFFLSQRDAMSPEHTESVESFIDYIVENHSDEGNTLLTLDPFSTKYIGPFRELSTSYEMSFITEIGDEETTIFEVGSEFVLNGNYSCLVRLSAVRDDAEFVEMWQLLESLVASITPK